jgi:hypothetical protein
MLEQLCRKGLIYEVEQWIRDVVRYKQPRAYPTKGRRISSALEADDLAEAIVHLEKAAVRRHPCDADGRLVEDRPYQASPSVCFGPNMARSYSRHPALAKSVGPRGR